MTPSRAHRPIRLLVVYAVLLLAACGDASDRGELAKARPGKVPGEPQRAGDALIGYDALLNRAVVTCGVPYTAYRRSRSETDAALRIPGRTGRNAELPYMVTAFIAETGVELVTTNCLGCHASPFNGKVVIGLGNEFMDFTHDPLVSVERVGGYVEGDLEAAEWRKWANRIAIISRYMMTDTFGVNPARNMTLAVLAHRDPETLAWSDAPLMDPPPERPLPVSVPPWWNMGKKHAMFYSAEGRGDHVRFLMLAGATCTDSREEAASIDAWFPHVRAYLASLEPPDYPFDIDEALAREGRDLFEDNCKRCHGTYGERGRYPNRLVALDKIDTDPALAERGYRDSDRFLRWFERSFYGEGSRAMPALGYIAPPLDGVWATAPYLHNGSVPSLEALLDSTRRPTHWRFASGEPEFDSRALGWAHVELEYGKAGAMGWDERNRTYDTSRHGYSNQGHTFGDDLTDSERLALLEYLKTL